AFEDPDRRVTWQGSQSKGPTRVGDNVWCGAHVVITSGVTIGERCVIGANSVVTEDLPPFSVAAGAPARVLRTIRGVLCLESATTCPRPVVTRQLSRSRPVTRSTRKFRAHRTRRQR